jgi:hypothetical protein
MLATLPLYRESAISFAGALIASLLFVSAAIGPLQVIVA